MKDRSSSDVSINSGKSLQMVTFQYFVDNYL